EPRRQPKRLVAVPLRRRCSVRPLRDHVPGGLVELTPVRGASACRISKGASFSGSRTLAAFPAQSGAVHAGSPHTPQCRLTVAPLLAEHAPRRRAGLRKGAPSLQCRIHVSHHLRSRTSAGQIITQRHRAASIAGTHRATGRALLKGMSPRTANQGYGAFCASGRDKLRIQGTWQDARRTELAPRERACSLNTP